MEVIPRHTLEPSWCPLHATPGPCLACLGPTVAVEIEKYHHNLLGELFIFLQMDQNDN